MGFLSKILGGKNNDRIMEHNPLKELKKNLHESSRIIYVSNPPDEIYYLTQKLYDSLTMIIRNWEHLYDTKDQTIIQNIILQHLPNVAASYSSNRGNLQADKIMVDSLEKMVKQSTTIENIILESQSIMMKNSTITMDLDNSLDINLEEK